MKRLRNILSKLWLCFIISLSLSSSFIFFSYPIARARAQTPGSWRSPDFSETILNVVEWNNGSRSKNVDFNSISWAAVKKAGLMLPREMNKTHGLLSGFETNYGSLLSYPLGYNKAPIHQFLKLHIKKGETWYEKYITNASSAKTPRYSEQIIIFNHSGDIIPGLEKELGYYTTLTELGYDFSIYVGLRVNQFSENFKIEINVTTPLDIDNVAVEYVFALNPNLVDAAKKIKWIRTWEPNYNGTTIINYTITDYEISQFIDKSGKLPDLIRKVGFITENGKELQLFDFEDVWNMSLSTFWKIEQLELPNAQTTYVLHIGSTFGSLDANQTLVIDPQWTSPTGYQDPEDFWNNEPNAYDEDTDTYTDAAWGEPATWGEPLILTLTSIINCNGCRWFGFNSPSFPYNNEIRVEMWCTDNESWVQVTEEDLDNQVWDEVFFDEMNVNMTRIHIKSDAVFGFTSRTLYEFDFSEVPVPPVDSAPNYSQISSNQTEYGQPCRFSAYWEDSEGNLSHYIFRWNASGSWTTNVTAFSAGVNASWGNHTETLPSSLIVIGWNFYANDTAGYLNNTMPVQILIITDSDFPQYSGVGHNTTWAGWICQFYAYWTDGLELDYSWLSWNNSETLVNETAVSLSGSADWSRHNHTITSTVGLYIQWGIYANDTSNNINFTGWNYFYSNGSYIWVYYNPTTHGQFRINNATQTNGQLHTYPFGTTINFELAALPLNSSIIFQNFTWTGGYNLTNPNWLNTTLWINMTVYCYFGDVEVIYLERRRGEYIVAAFFLSLICIPGLILIGWAIIRRKG